MDTAGDLEARANVEICHVSVGSLVSTQFNYYK